MCEETSRLTPRVVRYDERWRRAQIKDSTNRAVRSRPPDRIRHGRRRRRWARQPGVGVPLRRDIIVDYSDRFWNSRSPINGYTVYPNDCTNFVGQAWFGIYDISTPPYYTTVHGGPEYDYSSNPWHPGTNSWSVAQAFVNYQNARGPGYQVLIPYASGTTTPWTRLTNNQTPGLPGSVVIYRTGDGGSGGNYWSHAALITDWTWVGAHTDSVSHTTITYNATVDRINSHTAYRHREPWNIGFRTEQVNLSTTELNQNKANWDAIVMEL